MTGRRAAVAGLAGAAALIVFAGCTSAVTSTRTVYTPDATATAAPPGAACAWYSAGESPIITVTLAGASRAACNLTGSQLAADTRSAWVSTGIAPGELVMTAARGGVTLRMYQAGPGGRGFDTFSGYLADDLAANGWEAVP